VMGARRTARKSLCQGAAVRGMEIAKFGHGNFLNFIG
jgi:hypothetical protein